MEGEAGRPISQAEDALRVAGLDQPQSLPQCLGPPWG